MNDMSQVIVPKSDQINADDLIAGPRSFTIEAVEIRAGTEQPVNIHMVGEDRAWRPCKSMSRVLVAAWGPDANVYIGRSVTLYRDPKVKWGGLEVGGIRVSHLSHIEREMLLQLTATKGKRAPHIVKPLQVRSDYRPAGNAEQDTARAKARAGTETFTAWWNSAAGKTARPSVRPIMDEIKRLCAEADAAAADDPFLTDDNPTAAEGPADEDRGEAFTDTGRVSKGLLQQLRDEIADATDGIELEAVRAQFAAAKASLSDAEVAELDEAIAGRAGELG